MCAVEYPVRVQRMDPREETRFGHHGVYVQAARQRRQAVVSS